MAPPPPPPHTGDHRFPCDQCGADLRFDAGAERLVCDFCGNTQALPERDGDLRELPYKAGQATRLPGRSSLPSVRITPIWNRPAFCLVKAIKSPRGDQTGVPYRPDPLLIRVAGPPVAGMT